MRSILSAGRQGSGWLELSYEKAKRCPPADVFTVGFEWRYVHPTGEIIFYSEASI
jgi:hypothetical protein